MYVRELLTLGSLQPIHLLTGDAGLERHMKDVVLLEYDSFNQPQAHYYEEDFIISTLYFVKDHPELLYSTIARLIDLGAAGLAFKSVYYDTLPDDVIELAKSRQFPILKFDHLYIEDVILSITDYIRIRQEFSMYEDTLFKILQGTWEDCSIENLCARLNPNRQKYMNAVYVHSSDMSSDWSIHLRNSLQLRNSQRIASDYRFLQFRRGFFVLCNSSEPPSLSELGNAVMALLQKLGCDTSNLCFGVSGTHQRSSDFASVIRDAFDALLFGLVNGTQLSLFPDMKLYQTVFPIVRDRSSRTHLQRLLQRLIAYDEETASGNLMGTLKAFYQNNYDIARTAAAMGQHPNTIRYRIKKICELIATPRESAHALFLMGEYLRIDSLSSEIF